MKTKRILALVLCTLMMLASFGMSSLAAAPSSMSGQTLTNNTSEMTGINTTWAATYLAFSSTGPSSAKVTVGVPQTGYYNIQAVYRNHNGSYKEQSLITDFYVKTESGESFSYDKEKVQYTDYTVYADAPETVYLEKGDRFPTTQHEGSYYVISKN
jgi:hypothetical protein